MIYVPLYGHQGRKEPVVQPAITLPYGNEPFLSLYNLKVAYFF